MGVNSGPVKSNPIEWTHKIRDDGHMNEHAAPSKAIPLNGHAWKIENMLGEIIAAPSKAIPLNGHRFGWRQPNQGQRAAPSKAIPLNGHTMDAGPSMVRPLRPRQKQSH